jgi:hypothetical protein
MRIFFLTRTQVALGLLTSTCLVGAGVGITVYGIAKQGLQTPPPVAVNRQAAAPDLPPESRKGDVSVPIDPKLLAKLAEQLRSKNWDERSAALATLDAARAASAAHLRQGDRMVRIRLVLGYFALNRQKGR